MSRTRSELPWQYHYYINENHFCSIFCNIWVATVTAGLTSLGGCLQTPWKEPPKRTAHSIWDIYPIAHGLLIKIVNYFWGVLSNLQNELLHSLNTQSTFYQMSIYFYTDDNCIWCTILEGSYYSRVVYLAVNSVRLIDTNKLTFLIRTEGLQRNIMLSTNMFMAKCAPIRQKNCHWKWSYRVLKTKHLYLRQVCVRPVSRSLVAHNPVRKRNSRLQ